MSRCVLSVVVASVLIVALIVVATSSKHSSTYSSASDAKDTSLASFILDIYGSDNNENVKTGTGVITSSGTSGPNYHSFPIFPIFQATSQQSADMLAGGKYAADYIQAHLDSNGLSCKMPPEILLNTGTYEGEIFSAQILKKAIKGSPLHNVGLGIRNFAHSFTKLVELNLRAPCSKELTSDFTLPCNPAEATCDSSLSATQPLVDNVFLDDASKFKVVAHPLGQGDNKYAPAMINADFSDTSDGFLNFQGALIASGGLTHRTPAPFSSYDDYETVALIFSTAFSTTDSPPLPDTINTNYFWQGYYSALVGFQNWFACKASSEAQSLFPAGCFSKGGQGVF